MLKNLMIGLALGASAFAMSANAHVVSGEITGGSVFGTGSFQILDPQPGFTVGKDNQQSMNLFAFDEVQNFVLTADLMTSSGLIAAGTKVDSHYVFFDPRKKESVTGTVDFSGPILGILTDRDSLIATDGFLGNPDVDYLSPLRRGLERRDTISFSDDRTQLSWNASSPGDYVRVITAAVPEPATWLMMILGFGLVGATMRRRPAYQVTRASHSV